MKVYAVLPWSCGVYHASFHELDPKLGREDMLAKAWSHRVGSQYVSRIYRQDDDGETELWNERDGWSKATS